MCFSASASFGAGVFLTSVGVIATKNVNYKKQILFASIPILFGIQQITEGFLWLSLTSRRNYWLQQFTTYLFLIIAQIIWPIIIPLAIYIKDKTNRYKTIKILLLSTGIIVSGYLTYCLATFKVEAQIVGMHILYNENFPPQFHNLSGLLYIIATATMPLLSDNKLMRYLGITILVSYFFTKIFYSGYEISVWCFFASIISIIILKIILHSKINNFIVS
jgi:hypothetical protein